MIDAEALLALPFPAVEQHYGERDAILYALGCGYGGDPLDREQLRFVVETDLKVAPTMAVVLAYPGTWYRDAPTGIDARHVLHAAERIVLHAPLPRSGRVRATNRVVAVTDRGSGRGALIVSERVIVDADDGRPLATVTQTALARADGGFGGPVVVATPPHPLPERPADHVCTLPTQPQAALIYRLSGDSNPLHADPDFAAAVGFAQPILHGLATFGVVGHALLRSVCGYDPARLTTMECRFTAPVLPGQAIRTEIWQEGAAVAFRASVGDRVVVNNGFATLAPP